MKINRQLTKQVVNTYASILFEAARFENRVFEDVKAFEECVRIIRAHHELNEALVGTQLSAEAKNALVKDVFGVTYADEVVSTLAVMAERDDMEIIGRVAEAYRELAEQESNVVITEVTTAVPLDDHLRQVIKDKLSKQFGKQIYLEEKINPDIIGGVIINAQGKRIDASIATQLVHARTVLSKNVSTGGEE